MALISPGVDIPIIDQSNYSLGSVGSVPYILLATASNKVVPNSTAIASGTTAGTANALTLVSGQRDLVTLFGNPTFYQNATGTPLHGYELNEYGLMAAYSVLGVSNRVYIQRADIDLSELIGTAVRPTGTPINGSYWLDLATSAWGIFQWNAVTQAFDVITPIVIENVNQLTAGIPSTSVGTIGSYAIVATNTNNPTYYKMADGTWQLVGSATWQTAFPALQGTTTNPTVTVATTITINTVTVTTDIALTTAADLAAKINAAAITGVTADATTGKIFLYATDLATSDGVTADGKIAIADGSGVVLSEVGITAGLYAAPTVQLSAHTSVPLWKAADVISRPTGSVWVKTTAVNSGANMSLGVYSDALATFSTVSALLYSSDAAANAKLDPLGGGAAIAVNSVYVQADTLASGTVTYKLFRRTANGLVTVDGTATTPVFTPADAFTISVSLPGSATLSTPVTITVAGSTAADVVTLILNAGITNLAASVNSTGSVRLTHLRGGVINLTNTVGTPLTIAGITSSTSLVRALPDNSLLVSNWVPLSYTASVGRPSSTPANGRLWYYNTVDEADIMIHDGTNWRGYHNVTLDARGYDLSQTNPNGVIIAAASPQLQEDGTSLVAGDLWLDTSDLENYPLISRYDGTNWIAIDNTDQTSEEGILFADARWDALGTVNPITGVLPSVVGMLTTDYVDLDTPDPALFPRGTLLFNTRRSSFNVKRYVSNYFNANDFVGTLPAEVNTWVSVAGLKVDGSPWMGRKAMRQVVVDALRAGVAANEAVREEQRQFNLITCPSYPELNSELTQLNNDRRNTAFILADTPFRLGTVGNDIATFAGNTGASVTAEVALTTADAYTGVFYPAALSADLAGQEIVVPATHMALRTFIRSDTVSYPWFAAAGVRRGIIDNATGLGYVNALTGEFNQIGVTESVRDTCYTNNINPLTLLPGTGLVVYGNKSRNGFASALNRINVARLVVYLRRQLTQTTRPFVFEPNDKLTRDEAKQAIEKIMADLISKRAISDYLVVCDTSNNTPVRIDRNELWIDVAIVPIKAVEFIFIPVRILNTGGLGTTV